MPLLIDGYNLLNASGVFAKGRGAHKLERARGALLVFLGDSLSDEELRTTTIVFDAKDAPPGLPRRETFRGIQVRFASRHAEADDLIEELIREETSPRQLTVVSSDHRLQRAARRRKATAVDSDKWCAEVLRQVHQRERDRTADLAKPTLPLEEEDVEAWLSKFGDIEVPAEEAKQNEHTEPMVPHDEHKPGGPKNDQGVDDIRNPFPPGYAEDLLEEEGGSAT